MTFYRRSLPSSPCFTPSYLYSQLPTPNSLLPRFPFPFFFFWPSDLPTYPLAHLPACPCTLAQVPILPLSYGDAEPLLQALAEGGGFPAPPDWQGGFSQADGGGLVYTIGPGPAVVRLEVRTNTTTKTIWNVEATIPGEEEPEKLVLLGNHRDAWVFGAVDPNSGSSQVGLELSSTSHFSPLPSPPLPPYPFLSLLLSDTTSLCLSRFFTKHHRRHHLDAGGWQVNG